MLLLELDPHLDLSDVDVVDDLHHFMLHDPVFYKKGLFPAITHLRDRIKNNQPCSHKIFKKCVDNAVFHYCKKFNIPGNPDSVFTHTDRDLLTRKIFGQESENIANGHYDPREER